MKEAPRRTQRVRTGGRSARVEEAVLAAAADEFTRQGFASFSIERVARAADVSRSTVYRRWPTKVELIRDVLAPVLSRYEKEPDTGSSMGDLEKLLFLIQEAEELPVGRAFSQASLEAPQELASLVTEVRTLALAPFVRVLQRAADRQEIDSSEVLNRAHVAFFSLVMWRQTHRDGPSEEDCRFLARLCLHR